MPMETAEQLSHTLAEAFSKAAQPTDTRPQIIKLTDPPGKGTSLGRGTAVCETAAEPGGSGPEIAR